MLLYIFDYYTHEHTCQRPLPFLSGRAETCVRRAGPPWSSQGGRQTTPLPTRQSYYTIWPESEFKAGNQPANTRLFLPYCFLSPSPLPLLHDTLMVGSPHFPPLSLFLSGLTPLLRSDSSLPSPIEASDTLSSLNTGLLAANLLLFFWFFFWSIVALQCCVSFYYIPKWISYMHTYIPSFLDFLPI